MTEAGIRTPDSTERTHCVALNFGLLALETSTLTAADMNVYAWPQVSCSDEVLRRTDTRVLQGMQGIEDASAK